jgi:phytol kinase
VNPLNPFLAMAVVGGIFVALMGGVRLASQRLRLNPELSRKLIHIGMGLVTVLFPWLFVDVWAVCVLCLSFIAVLFLIRKAPPFRQRFGHILGGVQRQSWGEFYFPIAVAIVFTFAHQQRVWYVISLLVLTLGDAAAALVGIQYGRSRYQTDDGWKTIEGSLAFFVVALPATLIPALWLGNESLLHASIMAVCVGVLGALVEAISWRGLDNLFLPVATLVMLFRFAHLDTRELLPRPFVALGLLALLIFWRRRTTLRDGALAGAALTLYLFWAIGGWAWLLPPLVIALAYTFLPFRPQRLPSDTHGNLVILSLGAAGLFWMFLDKGLHKANYLLPYLLSFDAQLSMIFLARWKRCRPESATSLVVIGATFAASAFVFLPGLLLATGPAAQDVALALCIIAASTVLFWWLMDKQTNMPNSTGRWLTQSAVAFITSCSGLLPLFKSCPS